MPKDKSRVLRTPEPAKDPNSSANAKAAFKNFSLSKLPSAQSSRNYIAKGDDVRQQQKPLIQRQMAALTPTGPGMTVIFTDERLLKIKDGKVDLSTLLGAMDKARRGTQFYTAGTSTIDKIQIENQIDDFFAALKGKKNAEKK